MILFEMRALVAFPLIVVVFTAAADEIFAFGMAWKRDEVWPEGAFVASGGTTEATAISFH